MQAKLSKLICAASLALVLILAAAPGAQAISYYAYLQQYIGGQQPATPEPEQPIPPVSQPDTNYWSSRAASRKALLEKANLTAQPEPVPAPQPNPQPTPVPQPEPTPVPEPTGLTAREQQMLNLINKDRIAYGLKPLEVDMRLTRLARLKSQDIVDNNYFAHESPTYGTAFDMFRANNISFLRGGENLSKAGNVLVSHMRLMNSTNHRANLLTPQYTHIGIGIVDYNSSGIVVTEMFIQKP
jgi:uncharacterized YkwD family protein